MNALPPQQFDTSYRIYRKVYKDCTIHFEGNRYVVPHRLVGESVILREKDGQLRIFENNWLVITYEIPASKGNLIQHKAFYEALKKDQAMNRRKYHRDKRGKGRAKQTISPSKPKYDMDVEVRPVEVYDRLTQEVPS